VKVVENNKVPLIDLFAGAGGLGEGFSAFSADGRQPFSLRLSVECDPAAHATLELRSFFGQFATGSAPDAYYRHLRGEISREALFTEFPSQAERAIRATAILMRLIQRQIISLPQVQINVARCREC
jgi:DNA (cytosine-5)-methyltransferase 1